MIERLKALVGGDAVREGREMPEWAARGIVPRAVVAPGSDEEAAAVLELASAEGWVVEVAGAGTGWGAGRPPARLDLVLTTEQLPRAVEHEPADLVATAGAGLPLAALQARLSPHRQWLPLDPPDLGTSTVGGVVATASAGPLRLGHGTPRDHVLGLRIVTGDGRILDFGGRVMKNVAGYDLVKLIVGSRGTLGLVTRVHLRLRALPELDRTVVAAAPEPRRLLDLATAIRESRLEPVALELISPEIEAFRADGDAAWRLAARFQGSAEAVEDAVARVGSLPGGAEVIALADDAAAAGWTALAAAEARAPFAARLADRPAHLEETLGLADRVAKAAGTGARPGIAAHLGDGIVRVLGISSEEGSVGTGHQGRPDPAVPATSNPEAPGAPDTTAAPSTGMSPISPLTDALIEARAALAARRGTLIVARAPREVMEALDPWGDVGPALRLMRGLKEKFDPAGVLAPGRFVV